MTVARDMINRLAIADDLTDLVLTFGSSFDLQSEFVDTQGFHALSFALETSRVLNSSDVIVYSFTESDTSGGTYTAVPDEAILPARNQDDNLMVIAANGFIQTVGVFSTKRFVKLRLAGQADTSDIDLTPRPMLESDLAEFTQWDPNVVPSDGKP